MAHVKADRVQETTTSTGTGALTLAGATAKRIAFSAALADTDTCVCLIEHATAAEWEISLCTFASGAGTLTRSTIYGSTNGGSAVSFSAGTKYVTLVPAATKMIVADNSGTVAVTSASATSLAIGPNGATNPVIQVDSSTASQAAGLKLTGATSAGTVALAVISSGSNANLSFDAKGSGTITLGGTSTGNIIIARAVLPASNDGAAIGSSTVSFSDMFLASGGVINWANGNATLTHSSGLLTSSVPVLIGAVEISTDSNGALQMGGVNKTPYIDWNSYNGTPNDYDVRMVASGGSNGVNGMGTYVITANIVQVTGYLLTGDSATFGFASRTQFASASDGVLRITNNGATDFGRMQFGGTTSSFPALKRVATGLSVRLADDSADAPLTARNLYLNAPNTQTGASYTVLDTDNYIIANRAGTVTLTLPAASSYTGRAIMIKTIQAQTVVSASSNVVPRTGGAAGTAILAATDGAWALLVSDGTSWENMAGTP